MSDNGMTEADLEKVLRGLHAEGEYPKMIKTAENFRDSHNALNRGCHFQNPATTYQYSIALTRVGRIIEALSIRWGDMAGWPGFTDDLKGDWYRDGHARFFLSQGNFRAARGAVTGAMELHAPGTPKYLLDMLVMALVHVVENLPKSAYKEVKAVIDEMENAKTAEVAAWIDARAEAEHAGTPADVDEEPPHSFDSVERLANWWLLLLACATGSSDDISALATWVASHDVSTRRQTQALELRDLEGKARAKYAARLINKEIEGH